MAFQQTLQKLSSELLQTGATCKIFPSLWPWQLKVVSPFKLSPSQFPDQHSWKLTPTTSFSQPEAFPDSALTPGEKNTNTIFFSNHALFLLHITPISVKCKSSAPSLHPSLFHLIPWFILSHWSRKPHHSYIMIIAMLCQLSALCWELNKCS